MKISCAAGRILGLLAIIALVGCSEQSVRQEQPKVIVDAAADGLGMQREGRYQAAAQAFLVLAESATVPTEARRFRALAVSAYLDAGQYDDAATWSFVAPDALPATPPVNALELLNRARLEFESGDAGVAATDLEAIEIRMLSAYHRARANELRAVIAARNGDPLTAARLRLALDADLGSAATRQANHHALWDLLLQLSADQRSELIDSAAPQVDGWLELVDIARATLFDNLAFNNAVTTWQARYPDHPASISMPPYLNQFSQRLSRVPGRIALLLPYSGQFAEYAAAIRDGVMTAWFASPSDTPRPVVRNYNVSADDIAQAYEQAVADGAEVIIGPLEKPAVDRLLDLYSEFAVPTLTLNLASPDALTGLPRTRPNLFQFALSPEAEAAAVAEHVWQDGFGRVLLLTPDNAWGRRMEETYTREVPALGGEVLEVVRYQSTPDQYADAIERGLNIDSGARRVSLLRQILQTQFFTEDRRRTDVEAIILAGFPGDARQLLPQLRFQRAESIPVYASSHVFSGTVDRNSDQDLDGLVIGDMPWLLRERNLPVYGAVERNWRERANFFRGMFAFGIDAFNLSLRLGRLRLQPGSSYNGVSGDLSIAPNGIVSRQLGWARFVNGIPIPLPRAIEAPVIRPALTVN
ncbi:MAG: penicillin-binding protein activator [Gammaproteobacteria bacterium]|nr:penicillin-binding protein activator [Gammaproteobacteria bacterium]